MEVLTGKRVHLLNLLGIKNIQIYLVFLGSLGDHFSFLFIDTLCLSVVWVTRKGRKDEQQVVIELLLAYKR